MWLARNGTFTQLMKRVWMCLISLIAFLWQLTFRAFHYNHGSLSALHTVIYDPFSLLCIGTICPPVSVFRGSTLPGRAISWQWSLHSAWALVWLPLLWCCLNPRTVGKWATAGLYWPGCLFHLSCNSFASDVDFLPSYFLSCVFEDAYRLHSVCATHN